MDCEESMREHARFLAQCEYGPGHSAERMAFVRGFMQCNAERMAFDCRNVTAQLRDALMGMLEAFGGPHETNLASESCCLSAIKSAKAAIGAA